MVLVGDYFIAEMIECQDQDHRTIVAEVHVCTYMCYRILDTYIHTIFTVHCVGMLY